MTTTQYPEQYLHVERMEDGQTWIVPLADNEPLDLTAHLKLWIEREFGGELRLDGKLQSKLNGDYYARIMTDGRPPTSVVCWHGAGFYLTTID